MSFNYLEVEQAAARISKELPATVTAIELVEFSLGREATALADVNLAFRLNNGKSIVFSLKTPWVGLFCARHANWRQARKLAWAGAFSGASDWRTDWMSCSIESITALSGDRVVSVGLKKSDGQTATLRLELFPSRPNWEFESGGKRVVWKPAPVRAAAVRRSEPEVEAVPGSPMARIAAAVRRREGAYAAAALRDFGVPDSEWFEGAVAFYRELRLQALFDRTLQAALSQLESKMARLIRIRGQMQESLAESNKAFDLQQRAETLKARLHEFPPHHRAARIDDVELDPKLTLAENVMRWFGRAKKLKRTKLEVETRLRGIEESTRNLTKAVSSLRNFRVSQDLLNERFKKLATLLNELGLEEPGAVAPSKTRALEKKIEKAGIRRHRSAEGLTICVGRTHEENEELVIRLARGNDMWMHLKGKSGAHVVIQLPSGKSPSLETLLDAATLVAHYSGTGIAEKVEVDYTRRKNVKRVAGGGEGKFLVTYNQNKTLLIKIDPVRLARLTRQPE